MKPSGVFITYGMFHVRDEGIQNDWSPVFNETMTTSIENEMAVAVTDVSTKDGRMGGSWIIGDKNNRRLLGNKLYHKDWRENTSGAAEVIVLLELMMVIQKKGRNINSRKIIIGVDYKRAYKKIIEEIMKPNKYVQEARAEIALIKQLMKKINFEVEIKLMRGHEKGVVRYENEPVKWLIRQCDKEAEQAREEAMKQMRESNIKYYGRYSLMKDSIVQMRSVKEILRVIDSKEEESKQAKKKLEYKLNFVDLEARNSF